MRPENSVECVSTGYVPHRFQREIHANLKRFSVLVCHRRFGKTVLCVNSLVDAASRGKRENGRFAYIAPTYTQAKRVAWDYIRKYCSPLPGVKFNEVELRADLPNGARISLHGADNPDSLRGLYLDGAVLDEYADFRPEAYPTVIRPALSDRKGFAIFIGTPRGHNHFFDLYQTALRNPEWYAACFPSSKTDLIPFEELSSAKDQLTDAQYAQEYECSFDSSSDDVLIPLGLIQEAFDRDVHYPEAPVVMGADVGMSLGGDPSAVVIRQGGEVLGAEEFRFADTMQIAGRMREIYDSQATRPDQVLVDSIGWGAGVAHTLSGWGLPVVPVNVAETAASSERFNRRRDELWWKAREFFSEKQSSLRVFPLRNKLTAELSTPIYAYLPSGKIKVEGKDEMKRRGVSSPNLADAFVLSMGWVRKTSKTISLASLRPTGTPT